MMVPKGAMQALPILQAVGESLGLVDVISGAARRATGEATGRAGRSQFRPQGGWRRTLQHRDAEFDDLAVPIGIGCHGHYCRDGDDAAALAYLEIGGIES
jgi:hypothetical protein